MIQNAHFLEQEKTVLRRACMLENLLVLCLILTEWASTPTIP